MSDTKGFTLIEVLIVTVIVAILAAIAFPRFGNTSERGADAAAISDLRNAMSAQEAFLVDNQTYTLLSNLAVSSSIGVVLGGGGTAAGYRLTARHQSSSSTFEVSVGSGDTSEGRILKQ